MKEILKLFSSIDPEKALIEISKMLETIFSILGEQARSQFLWDMMGESAGDKVSSLVHL